jgi:DNA-binding MarR family transcriptional regulator
MGRTGNLSDAHSVLNSFRSIVKSLRLADRAGLKEHGLGASQVYILHELKNESPLSINDLAARMATDQSTVSVVVAKLIQKGFVSSARAETDARRLELALTAKGRTVTKRLPPPIQHSIVEGVQQLSAARAKALAEALRDIVSSLGIEDEPATTGSTKSKPAAKKHTGRHGRQR